jgi:acyl dehydratase
LAVQREDLVAVIPVDGPYFDELRVGQVFDDAPSVTLTDGAAAVHRSVVGDRLRLPLDIELWRRVSGDAAARPLAPPALVWDTAIGQSTLATRQVTANLFYRGLAFGRAPRLGDTLSTRTEVVALKQNSRRPDRPATGLAALRITTVDQDGRAVLDFTRCAMLPLRDGDARTGHTGDLAAVAGGPPVDPGAAVEGWDLAAFRSSAGGIGFGELRVGEGWEIRGGDVVSGAPELARLTLNLATVHHDGPAHPSGRLVYGGHTVGIALAQATRALPNLVTVVAWESCDHLGPVREGDTLYSTVEVESATPLPAGGGLAGLRSRVRSQAEPVLDWRFVAVLA